MHRITTQCFIPHFLISNDVLCDNLNFIDALKIISCTNFKTEKRNTIDIKLNEHRTNASDNIFISTPNIYLELGHLSFE